MTALIPIPTKYNGYTFRSRLEARWAMFFDRLKLKWEYEPEGYFLGDSHKYDPELLYLPDFLVRTPQNEEMWFEIKPFNTTINDKFDKFRDLIGWDTRALLLSGTPCDVLDKYCICPRCGYFLEKDNLDNRSYIDWCAFYCEHCDNETGWGIHDEIEHGLIGIPFRLHKGHIKLESPYGRSPSSILERYIDTVSSYAERCKTYNFSNNK
tara:strand:+ start:48 stop:674 length:627 start_codon:yes stop_codon:yes gene_type:complete